MATHEAAQHALDARRFVHSPSSCCTETFPGLNDEKLLSPSSARALDRVVSLFSQVVFHNACVSEIKLIAPLCEALREGVAPGKLSRVFTVNAGAVFARHETIGRGIQHNGLTLRE